LLTGGLSAAQTQQRGSGFSPMAGLYSGLANSPRLQTGFESLFGGGIGGAGGSGLSQSQMDALSRDAFNQTSYAGGIY
jgi:hypothetical protein